MTPSMNIRVNIFEKAHFNPLRELFWKKTLYFAYLLTKRENLSHSEAKFICRFLLCMKWVWQASVATPFFKIRKEACHIISRCDMLLLRGEGTSTLVTYIWILFPKTLSMTVLWTSLVTATNVET